jgi:hypothetical protein
MLVENCLVCEKKFEVFPCIIKKGFGKYCSQRCAHLGKPTWNKGKRDFITKGNCAWCGKHFEGYLKDQKCCSKSCATKYANRFGERGRKISEATSGEKAHQWKGGRVVNKGGYILIFSPNHPFRNSAGYVAEHRLIAEKYLGRYLTAEERVHHINHEPSDNRVENLYLFATASEHRKFHQLKPESQLSSNII